MFKHSGGWGGVTSAGSAGGSGAGFSLANNYDGTLETKWSIYLDGSTDALRFTANTPDQTSDEKLRIKSNGDVEWNNIGTATPGVSNSTVGMGFEPRNGTIFLSRADNATLLSNRNDDGRHIHFAQGGTQKFAIGLQNSGADLTFNSGAGVSPTERLRIDSSGRVMIGNTNASTMFGGADDLVVGNTSGAHGITIITSDSTVGRLLFSDSTSSAPAIYQGQINYNHSTDELDLRTYTGGSITFATGNTEKVRIDSAGDVFIGTSTDIAPTNGTNLCVSDATISRLILEKQSTIKYGLNVSSGFTIYDETNSAARFSIRSGGGVRINSTSSNEVHAISNYDHGNHDYSHRNNRVLTSNGTGWDGNDSTDGADPILILSVADRAGNSDIGDAYGLCLHSDSQDNNDYGPLIGWSNRSNSGAYNTTYAAIVGQKTGQATDHNWSSGALHFFTNKPGAGGYMSNVADLAINENGIVTKPYQPGFGASQMNGWTTTTGSTYAVTSYNIVHHNYGSHFNSSNGRFTAPVDGRYFFHAIGMGVQNSAPHIAFGINNSSNGGGPSRGGTDYGNNNMWSHPSSSGYWVCITHILDLSANDYVRVYTYDWNSSADAVRTYFYGYLMG